jgi:hypothetical protein
MIAKTAPVGICDHCAGPIHPDEWFTRRGPRRYCCIDCRNTANSRNGNPVRTAKLRESVAAGAWHNPRERMTPEQISAVQSHASRAGRLREVREGRWRNPALDAAAREKLSRPRKHAGALHIAIERIRAGAHVADLTIDEQAAYRAHAHALRERYKRDEAFIQSLRSRRDIADLRVSKDVFAIRLDLWPAGVTHALPSYDPDARQIVILPVPAQRLPLQGTYRVSQNGRRMAVLASRLLKRFEIAAGEWQLVAHGAGGQMVFERA